MTAALAGRVPSTLRWRAVYTKRMSSPTELTPALIRAAVIDRLPPSAVRALVTHLGPIVKARVACVLLRRGRRGHDVRQEVADLTQDVFAALFDDGGRRLLAWDPERASARTFFSIVTERLVLNRLTSKRLNPWTDEAQDPVDMSARLEARLDTERLMNSRDMLRRLAEQLQAELSERDQRLFELLYVELSDVPTVMARLNMSRDAVYQAKRRLIRRLSVLRAQLKGDA